MALQSQFGSEFTRNEVDAARRPELILAAFPPDPMPSPSRRILVVDDAHDAAETLARVLGILGHEAQFVTDPRRAMDAAADMRAEAAFVDIGMPHIDGYKLAALLRSKFPAQSLRLVAHTAWGREEDLERAWAAGFDAHLTKPATLPVIEGVLSRMFGGAADETLGGHFPPESPYRGRATGN
jgi:CheY-like chemotaxis protein